MNRNAKLAELDSFVLGLEKKFGHLQKTTCGYVDVELGSIPPFISRDPSTEDYETRDDNPIVAQFPEIKTDVYDNINSTMIELMAKIKLFVEKNITNDKFKEKTLVWRVMPEINEWKDINAGTVQYAGYTRMAILEAR